VGCLLYRNLSLKDLFALVTDAAVTSGVVMLIIALAGIFAWAGTTLGTFQHLANALLSLSENGWVLLGLVMVLVLIAGMLLDAVSIYLISPVSAWNKPWAGLWYS